MRDSYTGPAPTYPTPPESVTCHGRGRQSIQTTHIHHIDGIYVFIDRIHHMLMTPSKVDGDVSEVSDGDKLSIKYNYYKYV